MSRYFGSMNQISIQMNTQELRLALDLLLKQVSPKATGSKQQHRLINLIADLQILIKEIENPEKINKLRRMFEW